MKPVTEKQLDSALLVQRVIFALAFIYLALGAALHLNAFIQNGIDVGLPFSSVICTAAVGLSLLCSLFILLGFFWKPTVICMIVLSLFYGFFFFAGSINKISMLGVLFALLILSGFLLLGPGNISLTRHFEKKRQKENKRITFR